MSTTLLSTGLESTGFESTGFESTSAQATASESTAYERASEVMLRLAKRGFARTLEAARGHLWCPSCDTDFDTHDLVVEDVVVVTVDTETTDATIYALRCHTCGAAAIWLIRHPVSTADLRLMEWLRTSNRASASPCEHPRCAIGLAG